MNMVQRSIAMLVCLWVASVSYGFEWNQETHDLLEADINNDGYTDVLLRAKRADVSVEVPYSIGINLQLPPSGVHDVILYGQADGSYVLDYSPLPTLVGDGDWNPSGWLPSAVTPVVADYDGDGKNDLLITPILSGGQTVVLLSSEVEQPSLVQNASSENSLPSVSLPARGSVLVGNGNGSNTVASVSGSFSVSSGGRANYVVPIKSLPSVAGIAPSVSLAYSGNSANGVLGVGWYIDGIPSIERCPTMLDREGYLDAVNFNNQERFCINGQPLVAVNGTYGADQTEYRTENESFAKIISYGSTASGPQYFKVWKKDGLIETYGESSDSRIEQPTNNAVHTWFMNEIIDREQNYATIEYSSHKSAGGHSKCSASENEHLVCRINFTGNRGSAPSNSLRFEYETRTDVHTKYQEGIIKSVNQRLKAVKSYLGSTVVRSYTLGYEYGNESKSSQLSEIEECLSDSECAQPTDIDWGQGATVVNFSRGQKQTDSTQYYSSSYSNPQTHLADVNGDGRSDLIFTYRDANDLGRVLYLANNSGTTFTRASNAEDRSFNASFIQDDQNQQYLTGDVNGDGKADLVWIARNNNDLYRVIYTANSAGTGFTSQGYQVESNPNFNDYENGQYLLGDVNGDGRSDLIWAFTFNNSIGISTYHSVSSNGNNIAFGMAEFQTDEDFTTIPYENKRFSSADVNGDGKTDLIFTYTFQNNFVRTVYLAKPNGGGFTKVSVEKDQFTSSFDNFEDVQIKTGDVNGDDRSDFVFSYRTASKMYSRLYLATERGTNYRYASKFDDTPNNHNPDQYSSQNLQLADLNSDGRADLLFSYAIGSTFGWVSYIANQQGNGFVEDGSGTTTDANPGFKYQQYLLGDINADAKPDLVWTYLESDDDLGRVTLLLPTTYPDHIEKITDGFGNETIIDYQYLADVDSGNIYTKGTGSQYPVRDDNGLSYVVSRVQQSDGVGGYREYTYKYKGAKTHLRGRGFLGFESREVKDVDQGIVTTETYRQDWPFIGLPHSIVVETTSGGNLERTFSHWKKTTLGTGSAQREFRYLKDEAAVKYAPGTSNVIFAGLTINDFDFEYGLLDTETKIIGNGVSGASISSFNPIGSFSAGSVSNTEKTVSTEYGYNNSESNWRIGFVDEQIITTSKPALGSESVTNIYVPKSPSSFQTTRATLFSGTNLEHTIVYISRDAYGNPLEVITQGSDYNGVNLNNRSEKYGSYAQGLYPSYYENALGHRTDLEYDPITGNVEQSTNENGNTVDKRYDDFGRLIYTQLVDGTDIETTYHMCGSCPSSAAYYTVTETTHSSQGAPDVTRYFDSFGREVRNVTEDFSGGSVYVTTTYDNLGRIDSVSIPSYSTNAAATEYQYDLIGRVEREDRPDSSYVINNFSSSGSYAVVQTSTETIIDPLNGNKTVSTVKRFNAQNQVEQAEDDHGTRTDFEYDVWDNVEEITVNNDSSTTIVIDVDEAGFKRRLNDPDAGIIDFDYDSFGNLRRQIQNPGANQQVTVNTYDKLNRKLTQTDSSGGDTTLTGEWKYDTRSNGIGLLASVTGPEYNEDYYYDGYSRVNRKSTTLLNMPTRSFYYNYDNFSRVKQVAYPGELTIANSYNPRGYLTHVTSVKGSKVLWNATDGNQWGNITDYNLGNGLNTSKDYDNVTGLIESIKTGTTSTNGSIQNNGYTFDSAGNLTRRTVSAGLSAIETFSYDNLHRLKTARTTGIGSGTRNLTYDYDALGNIIYKSGVSDVNGYKYDKTNNAGPHAVTRTVLSGVTTNYGYDAKGNITSNGNKTLGYTVFNKPSSIVSPTASIDFKYAPNRSRFYQRKVESNNVTETLYYGGGSYEIVKEGNAIRQKAYVGDFLVHQTLLAGANLQDSVPTLGEKFTYIHRDNLGSTDAVTNGNGELITRNFFDPFGLRRDVNFENATPQYLAALPQSTFETTTRGYTGHEQLDSVGLIHMNGRVYDPTLGRFLSPDDFVQFPYVSQSYNRYTYVLNNPLSYTDPSGEFIPVLIYGAVLAYKAYNVYDTVTSGVEDIKTLTDDNASTVDKVIASASLAGSASGVMPKSVQRAMGAAYDKASKTFKGKKGQVNVDANKSNSPNKNQSDAKTEKVDANKNNSGCHCCFVGDTLVMTQDGFKPIDEIRIGDLVASKDEVTGEVNWKPVTEKFVYDDDRITWSLRLVAETGEVQSFEVTDNHPFWVEGHGWMQTKELVPGMTLVTYEGFELTVESVQELDRSPITYNLEVADFHTFFVGEQKVWVHNQGKGDCCGGSSSSQSKPKKLSKNAKKLRNGGNHTTVDVKNKKEADKLLKEAFPDYKKVRGIGHEDAKPLRRKRKMDEYNKGGAYHKDYAVDKETGRVVGHAEGNKHGEYPHINIKRTDRKQVLINITGDKK